VINKGIKENAGERASIFLFFGVLIEFLLEIVVIRKFFLYSFQIFKSFIKIFDEIF
jgi:hypothetical protein